METSQITTSSTASAFRQTITHHDALDWLRQLESHHLDAWIGLPQATALRMAPSCLDKTQPLEERAKVIALLAAQMDPMAETWLQHLSEQAEGPLKLLASVAGQQVRVRLQALTLCLNLKGF